DALHHKTASDAFLELNEKGAFVEKESEQYFDEEYQQFLADRYITGTCPNCGFEEAYGDQCEKCGSTLNPMDLKNPKSKLSGKTPQLKKTKHWYLPLDQYENWLREWLEKGELEGKKQHDPKAWKKNVLGQCLSWLNNGLQPRAVTRDLDWGVKVPLKDAEGKVLYVWLDAPIGYISATKAWAEKAGKNWKDYWQNPDTKLIHFIGKDNIVFHCIIFPAILKELGGYNLPDNVPANEFLNLEGRKISTSRNWAVWLHEYLEDFPNRQDELRYVLTTIAPETSDSEFTWEDYQKKVNNELVATLGNFINRVMVLTSKYYNGKLTRGNGQQFSFEPIEKSILESYEKEAEHIGKYEFRNALSSAMELARKGNKYLAESEPWKLAKTDENATADILFNSIQIVGHLGILLEPFLPETANRIREMLHLKKPEIQWGSDPLILPEGHQIGKAQLLFQKIEDKEMEAQVEKLHQSVEAAKPQIPALNSEIEFDDFVKLDIRVGEILSAEKVKKANKLLLLTVDIGLETREIVSGIAQHFKPEELPGKKVCVVANLAPKKLRGVLSKGMILMAESADGKLEFIQPGKDMSNGSVVR
ncbi:MAG: methionine--tRNA ligase, partial [Chitinophagales bacterium]